MCVCVWTGVHACGIHFISIHIQTDPPISVTHQPLWYCPGFWANNDYLSFPAPRLVTPHRTYVCQYMQGVCTFCIPSYVCTSVTPSNVCMYFDLCRVCIPYHHPPCSCLWSTHNRLLLWISLSSHCYIDLCELSPRQHPLCSHLWLITMYTSTYQLVGVTLSLQLFGRWPVMSVHPPPTIPPWGVTTPYPLGVCHH